MTETPYVVGTKLPGDLAPADLAPAGRPPAGLSRSRSRWRIAMGAVIGVGCSLVANAIWNEVAPERGWGKQLLLRILSLGLVQTKDATYREAARGLAERSSDEVLWIVVFFIFLAVAILLRMLSWDITGNRPKPQEKPTVASSAKRKALFYITAPVTFLLGLSL